MKVTDVHVSVLEIPMESSYEIGGRKVSAHWHVLARITTEDGIRGFGYNVSHHPRLIAEVAGACRDLGRDLIGTEILEVEAAWEKLTRAGRSVGPGGLLHHAIAPLDIALWDAAGKAVGQPLYRLFGGYRDRVDTYLTDGFMYDRPTPEIVANARKGVAQGFTGLKLRFLGGTASPADELRRVMAVREEVGAGVRILMEAGQRFDVDRAIAVGRALEPAAVHWIEDPVHHKNFAGLARIASRLDVPVATGENLYELGDYLRLFQARAAGIAIIDLSRVGGFTPWRRVAALAQAHGLRVCGHVVPELHVHALAAIPNGHLVEYGPRSAPILESMPAVESGSLVAPNAPGLGLTLDEAAVRRYTVD